MRNNNRVKKISSEPDACCHQKSHIWLASHRLPTPAVCTPQTAESMTVEKLSFI